MILIPLKHRSIQKGGGAMDAKEWILRVIMSLAELILLAFTGYKRGWIG
jgi:hypothetical protein